MEKQQSGKMICKSKSQVCCALFIKKIKIFGYKEHFGFYILISNVV